MTAAPLVWINAFPGCGKLTVARSLVALDETIILIDNHQMIDPVEAKFPRSHPEYQAERQRQRNLVFDEHVVNVAKLPRVVVFTDFQSTNEQGQSVSREYEAVSKRAGRPFMPVYLTCDLEENLKRASSLDRVNGKTTKLTNIEVLRDLRQNYEPFQFKNHPSLTIDVTDMDPVDTATKILSYIRHQVPNVSTSSKGGE